MLKKVTILEKIVASGIVAVIRGESPQKAAKTAEAVIKGGVKGIELTFTVPQIDKVIAELSNKYHDSEVAVGAGTVLDATSARIAILAGAEFIVSPSFNVEVAKICNLYQIPYVPGCMTVTEVQTALSYGVDIIKLFPGSVTGSKMINAIHGPLPDVSIMPTGGVSLDNMEDWFKAGAIVVGTGSNLTGAADQDDFETVTTMAEKYTSKLTELRRNA
ncbi:2-keto-3-deoxy-6-phosphogluconate aldolase [Liquorilactobacillus ghanensis DSM 18630]|uniref:2-keto-3-deoxy-6-phosphogluconate aldolase n=1 Tax=Liquorilactobacillus ghanensis DSM 18630 TaxID=1423750 RepID=A0A0R1VLP8_9LACO|nr:2-keto-3-deoxy-6-phosphogluconate aldolase [Liquorilactobacillus ghanensis DSM 18630]